MESFNQNMNTESIMKAFAGIKFSKDIGNILEEKDIPYEVIDGIVCMQLNLSKSLVHDISKKVIWSLLEKNLQLKESQCEALVGLRLLRGELYPMDFLKPDVSILDLTEMSLGKNGMCLGIPKLVIEIKSGDGKSSFHKKRLVYQEIGVPEYWSVDLDTYGITQFILENGSYGENGIIYTSGTVKHHICDVELKIEEVFEQIRGRLIALRS